MHGLLRCAALAAALWSTGAQAAEVVQGDLTITDARAFATPPTARAGAGYMTIANSGAEADFLVGVEGDYPRVELHQSLESDGVMTMEPVARLEIPAGDEAVLEPGGYHVMIMGLTPGTGFKLGETVSVTLHFERAGEVSVALDVVARGAGMGH